MSVEIYRAHVLNLYDNDNLNHFSIAPGLGSVVMEHKNINDNTAYPIEFPLLTTGDINVADKMADNEQKVLAEEVRAVDAESALQSAVDTNRLDFESADLVLSNDIASEVSRSTNRDDLTDANLAAESLARQSADNVLQSNLDSEVARAQGAESAINTTLSDYQIANDAKVDADILELSNYQSSNDLKLDNHVANYDAYVVSNDARSSQIEADVAQNASDASTAVSDEEAARIAAIDNLQTQINNLIANTDATALNSLAEIVADYQNIDAAVISRLDSIEQTLVELINQH
jgi:hypothetical protein